MAAFGEDRVMFGGDWPNSVGTATIPQSVAMMRDYFADKPRAAGGEIFLAQQPAHLQMDQAGRQPAGFVRLNLRRCGPSDSSEGLAAAA